MTAADLIRQLNLQPHPEGGFYKEVYRSKGVISEHCLPHTFGGPRHYATGIYYLLQQGDSSAFHRIKSDEAWHFYAGGELLLHLLCPDGSYRSCKLGNALAGGAVFQLVVPAGVWFGAEPTPGTAFTLAGCTVSPGFDFRDFELAESETLALQYPEQKELIGRLGR